MEPRLKAKELVDKMENPLNGVTLFKELRKSLALIAVDEILKTFIPKNKPNYISEEITYWQQVKQEIENL